MRKILFVFSFLFIGVVTVNAQELGVRFGDATAGNVAIDAVFSTGDFSRIHADVSFGNGGVGVDALWDFIYQPLSGEALNWYMGAGPFAFIGDDFQFGAVGEIGLEYVFKETPLAVGVDWRPYLRIVDDSDFGVDKFGLNIRYRF